MPDDPSLEDGVRAIREGMPCSVSLPAGCGKTELIAAVVAATAADGGTALVLTHTHAGVDALRRRMAKFEVPRDQVVVRTIDSWAFDLISHFPLLAELDVPPSPDWNRSAEYHRGAATAAQSQAVRKMLRLSYDMVLVDEYQDCLIDQHGLVVAVAQAVPTTVLGDPLQSLFNFGGNQPVDWAIHVLPTFPLVEVDYRPRRWPENEALGTWLVEIRENLLQGRPIDFSTAPIALVRRDDARTFVRVCFRALKLDGAVAVLGQFRNDCVSAASNLQGTYSVMEAIDEKVPAKLASTIDTKPAAQVAKALVDFAINASAGLAGHIPSAKRVRLGNGQTFTTTKDELKSAYAAINNVRSKVSPTAIRAALTEIAALPGVTIHCREAWYEVTRSIAVAETDDCTVAEALLLTRNHARVAGRRPSDRIVTRPLLAKGLEYDHVVILDPSRYSAQELYVALSRGARSVTVIAESPVLAARRMAGGSPEESVPPIRAS
ncbi:UvrD-helicase domain-containing protein [Nocardioides jensenii]|uniref:UvrD-helicase domain-containing protein n=1 Tax=Nocardioides jensenii TaxID=1843 RepID=UPI0009EACD60|nr:UvrD-helicase domain-containing protein [Nocardioides jensenii]